MLTYSPIKEPPKYYIPFDVCFFILVQIFDQVGYFRQWPDLANPMINIMDHPVIAVVPR